MKKELTNEIVDHLIINGSINLSDIEIEIKRKLKSLKLISCPKCGKDKLSISIRLGTSFGMAENNKKHNVVGVSYEIDCINCRGTSYSYFGVKLKDVLGTWGRSEQ